MKEWIVKLLQDSHGDPNEAIVVAVLGMIAFIGLEIFATATGKHFDPQGYGIGYAAVVAAMGGAVKWGK